MASLFPWTATVPFEKNIEQEDRIDLREYGFFGKDTISPRPAIPAYGTFQHLIYVGEFGSAPGDLHWPHGVSIQEDTAQIYVADSENQSIQVFSESGKHLKQLEEKHLSSPWGIATHENNVFVTDCEHHTVLKFKLPYFKMVKRIGVVGSGNCQFNSPRQLAISPTRLLYVADQFNNRVQILSCNLVFQRLLQHQSMTNPVDVKFSADQVFVLSCSDDPCIHTFTFSGDKIRSIIRKVQKQVRCPYFFCMDADNNFIISDALASNVKVFSPEGDLLHTIGEYGRGRSPAHYRGILRPGMFSNPHGVSILQQTHLVCIDCRRNSGIMIFSEF